MLAESDGKLGRPKRQQIDGDLDITPMIDVTFLLLIFFMVTSTMRPALNKDLPPAVSGENVNAATPLDLSILTPVGEDNESSVMLDGEIVTLDALNDNLEERARGGIVNILIYAERDVRSGFVGEVEDVLNEVEGDVVYMFAVRDY